MILQATLILPIYIGLGLIQVQRYYQLQDYKPDEQKKYLRWAYQFLRITSWVYIPQKVVPAAFALYWLGMSELNSLGTVVESERAVLTITSFRFSVVQCQIFKLGNRLVSHRYDHYLPPTRSSSVRHFRFCYRHGRLVSQTVTFKKRMELTF